MEKKGFSSRASAILLILDFTPKTLSKAMGISVYKANRILTKGKILMSEFLTIMAILRSLDANILMWGAEKVYGDEGSADNG